MHVVWLINEEFCDNWSGHNASDLNIICEDMEKVQCLKKVNGFTKEAKYNI